MASFRIHRAGPRPAILLALLASVVPAIADAGLHIVDANDKHLGWRISTQDTTRPHHIIMSIGGETYQIQQAFDADGFDLFLEGLVLYFTDASCQGPTVYVANYEEDFDSLYSPAMVLIGGLLHEVTPSEVTLGSQLNTATGLCGPATAPLRYAELGPVIADMISDFVPPFRIVPEETIVAPTAPSLALWPQILLTLALAMVGGFAAWRATPRSRA